MHWQEICENTNLKNLPFKIESNKWGKVVMSPASNEHGIYQALIIKWLALEGDNGQPISECSIQTDDGVKVADVAWGSYQFFHRNKRSNPYLESPEIIIEILSPSNSAIEMLEKKELYFAKGAEEFWVCLKDGKMQFFNNQAELNISQIIKNFPGNIEINFA